MLYRLFSRRGRSAPAFQDIYDRIAAIRDLPFTADYAAIDRQRDFRTVFRSGAAGRRVLAQILDRCRVCERSFVPGDGSETVRREGMRDVGIWLVDVLAEDIGDRPHSAEAEAPARPDAAAGDRT